MVKKNFLFVVAPEFLVVPRVNAEILVTYEFLPRTKTAIVRSLEVTPDVVLNISTLLEVKLKLLEEINQAAQHNADVTFKTTPLHVDDVYNEAYQELKKSINY